MGSQKLNCPRCNAANRLPEVTVDPIFVCQWCGEKTEIPPLAAAGKSVGQGEFPELMKAHSAFVGKPCSRCRKPFQLGDPLHNCPECAQPSHKECWDLHAGCGNPECPEAGLKVPLPEKPPQGKTIPSLIKIRGTGFAVSNLIAVVFAGYFCLTAPIKLSGAVFMVLFIGVALANARAGKGIAEGEAESVWLAVFLGCSCLTPSILFFIVKPLALFLYLGMVFLVYVPPLYLVRQKMDRFEYRWGMGQEKEPAKEAVSPGCLEYFLILGLAVIIGIFGLTNMKPYQAGFFQKVEYNPVVKLPELHNAADRGDLEAVDRLLGSGANVDAIDHSLSTPLFYAVQGNKPLVVRRLLAKGAKANSTAQNGEQTVFHAAIKNSNLDIILLLLDAGANIQAGSSSRETPLHLAVEAGNIRITKLLLDRGANLQARNKDGRTPFHNVTTREMVSLLLQKGALLQAGDLSAASPLHHAVYFHRLEAVQALVDAGADVNAPDKFGEGPLHKTICGRPAEDLPIAKFLLARGANIQMKSSAGETPSQLALKRGNQEMAGFFRQNGAE